MSEKKFRPTRSMVKLLQVYVSLEPNKEVPTNVLLATETGINVRTLYKWYRKRHFQEWWDTQVGRYVKSRLDRVWTAVYHAAMRGDGAQAKLFAERFDPGYKPTTKKEVEHSPPPLQELSGQRERIGGVIGRFESLRRGSVN